MAYISTIKIRGGRVGLWELTESSDELLKRYKFFDQETEKFSKLKIEKRRKEFLAVRLLLEKMIKSKKEITYNSFGKPQLKDRSYNISISHSNHMAVVSLSQLCAGIDTESLDRNVKGILNRFLTEKEIKDISGTKNPSYMQVLYWSAKEAAYKCITGQNINMKEQLIIDPFKMDKKGGVFTGKFKMEDTLSALFFEYFFLKNNVVVFCVEKEKI